MRGLVRLVGFVAITPSVGGEVMGSKYLRRWQPILIAGMVLVVAGCATTETTVSCEGRLQPINARSTAQAPTSAKTGSHLSAGVTP